MIEMAEIPYLVARPYAAPPGIPADRAQALQEAFMASARDPEFVKEAAKINLELTPLDAKQTLAVVQRLLTFRKRSATSFATSCTARQKLRRKRQCASASGRQPRRPYGPIR